jgi:hypothetical protein
MILHHGHCEADIFQSFPDMANCRKKRRSISTGVKHTKNQYAIAVVSPVPCRAINDEIAATYSVTDSVGIYLVKPASTSSFKGGCIIAPLFAAASSASAFILIMVPPFGVFDLCC